MTASFVKTQLGNKYFSIEWILDVNNNEVEGEAFQITDCTLISMSVESLATSGPAILSKLYASNHAGSPDWYSRFIPLRTSLGEDTFLMPLPTTDVPLPPPTRWLFPRSEGPASIGIIKIVALFQVI